MSLGELKDSRPRGKSTRIPGSKKIIVPEYDIPWDKIDPGILDLVLDLNVAGYKTLFSCEGKQSPEHAHDFGGAYLAFDGWLPKDIIRKALKSELAVTLFYGATKKRTAFYSYWALSDTPFNRSRWKLLDDGLMKEMGNRRAIGPYEALPVEKRYEANRAFQGKIREVFEI